MPEPKLTSKSLSYSSSLPPFLRDLHAQAGGAAAQGPDPILAGRRRAIKKRSSSEEAEDQPVVVDEHGNTVQVDAEDESELQALEDSSTRAKDDSGAGALQDGSKSREKLAGIGAGRKRKVGRIIGAEDDKPGTETTTSPAGPPTKQSTKPNEPEDDGTKKQKPKKKMAKKIKLSFDPE